MSSIEQERVRQREDAHVAVIARAQAFTGRCVAQKLAKASMIVLRGYRQIIRLTSPQTLTVLNPLHPISQHIMDDSDLAGPILFFLLFGTFLLFSGKVHFGYIYGLALVGSLSLHTIFSLMSPDPSSSSPSSTPAYPPPTSHDHMSGGQIPGQLSSTLTLARSASVLGYCLLPLVLTSFVGVVLPMDTAMGYVISSAAICWCTYSSSKMFCAVGRMRSMRGLVAYPLGLFYVGFGIMGIFSSKGGGNLQRAATA